MLTCMHPCLVECVAWTRHAEHVAPSVTAWWMSLGTDGKVGVSVWGIAHLQVAWPKQPVILKP